MCVWGVFLGGGGWRRGRVNSQDSSHLGNTNQVLQLLYARPLCSALLTSPSCCSLRPGGSRSEPRPCPLVKGMPPVNVRLCVALHGSRQPGWTIVGSLPLQQPPLLFVLLPGELCERYFPGPGGSLHCSRWLDAAGKTGSSGRNLSGRSATCECRTCKVRASRRSAVGRSRGSAEVRCVRGSPGPGMSANCAVNAQVDATFGGNGADRRIRI